MAKIGLGSSKKLGAKRQENEAKDSKKDRIRDGGGVSLWPSKRIARVAPARTVFVTAAADNDPVFATGKKRSPTRDHACLEEMASNEEEEQKAEMEMDAELSPGNNGRLYCILLHTYNSAAYDSLQ